MLNKSDYTLLKSLSEAIAPSGMEEAVRKIIEEYIRPFSVETRVDEMGNLFVKKGNGGNIIFEAHMDEVGFMITGIQEDGTLRFDALGGINERHLPAKRLRIGESSIPGVICTRPIHLARKERSKALPNLSEMFINIGAKSKAETEKFVKIGDCAVFETEFDELLISEKSIKGKALDDRIGCFILLKLIKNPKIENAEFVFTVQEEIGMKGACAAARQTKAKYAVCVETTTASDLPGVEFPANVCRQEKGPVISLVDGATIYSRQLIDKIFADLQENMIPCQTKTLVAGGNDAAAFQRYGEFITPISVSIPCRFIHSTAAIAKIFDMKTAKQALVRLYTVLSEDNHA